MVHGSLTRSKRYSLFFTNRKWEKVSTALWQGKGLWYPLPSLAGKGIMAWSVAHSTSSISQSSGTSGSSLAGVGDVVGWTGDVVDDTAVGGVDGARMSVREKEQHGRMGSLPESARGNETGSENGRGCSV